MVKISVIMGVYNTSNYAILNKAVNSILNQTYKNFEFIICDDGSTDNTYEKLKNIERSDRRIKIIKNDINRGLAYTLNHCISVSNGEYIARMDADDISLTNRFELELKFLEENLEYDFVGCNVFLIDDKGCWGKRCYKEKVAKKDFLFNSPFTHPTIMIRKHVIDTVGGYRVEKITRRAEDYELWMRLYANGFRGYNIQDFLFEYREDNKTFARRKYKYRLDEAMIRYKGFKSLGLMPVGLIYVLKPIILGMIPQCIYRCIKKYQFRLIDNR